MPLQIEQAARPMVLVTGAAGKIGRHVTAELIGAGFAVRALTTKLVDPKQNSEAIEWRTFDFTQSLDLASHVDSCAAVVHLAAEIVDRGRMQRVNVEATQALAKAAGDASVKVFCYVSSAAVYGSSRMRHVTESSPTIDPTMEVKGEHWAPPAVRHYARTKLLGEWCLTELSANMSVIIVRPTVVVDKEDIEKLARRGRLRKMLVGRRHAHHVYVADVAAAISWLVEQAVNAHPVASSIAIYNIAEDEVVCRSYSDVSRRLDRSAAGRQALTIPSLFDQVIELARFGALPWRHTFGRMIFSGRKLEQQGFRFPHGIERLYECMQVTSR